MPHNFPKAHRLYRAAEEFESAAKAWQAMGKVGVRPIKELEDSWSLFLMHVERLWNKLLAAGRDLPGWQKIESEASNLRKNDPALKYAHHARNATEHTIQEFAVDWNGPLVAVPTQNAVDISWPAWDRPLLPVKDRGQIYQPPKKHLDLDISKEFGKGMPQAYVVGEHVLRFYFELLNRAAREVQWPKI
jgi:hypothetical protein